MPEIDILQHRNFVLISVKVVLVFAREGSEEEFISIFEKKVSDLGIKHFDFSHDNHQAYFFFSGISREFFNEIEQHVISAIEDLFSS